jgi:hypothetical protein
MPGMRVRIPLATHAAIPARDPSGHGVAVVPAAGACAAARSCAARRFDGATPPTLPLPDCSQPDHCGCRVRLYAERRGDRRPANRTRARSGRDPGI